MTIAKSEGGIRGVSSNRHGICIRAEHCDTFSKSDCEHFVISSWYVQLSFQVAEMAGLMIPSYRVSKISGITVHKISELGRMRLA